MRNAEQFKKVRNTLHLDTSRQNKIDIYVLWWL